MIITPTLEEFPSHNKYRITTNIDVNSYDMPQIERERGFFRETTPIIESIVYKHWSTVALRKYLRFDNKEQLDLLMENKDNAGIIRNSRFVFYVSTIEEVENIVKKIERTPQTNVVGVSHSHTCEVVALLRSVYSNVSSQTFQASRKHLIRLEFEGNAEAIKGILRDVNTFSKGDNLIVIDVGEYSPNLKYILDCIKIISEIKITLMFGERGTTEGLVESIKRIFL